MIRSSRIGSCSNFLSGRIFGLLLGCPVIAPFFRIFPLGYALLVQASLRALYLLVVLRASPADLASWLGDHPVQSARLVVYLPLGIVIGIAAVSRKWFAVGPSLAMSGLGACDALLWMVIFASSDQAAAGAPTNAVVEALCFVVLVTGLVWRSRLPTGSMPVGRPRR
jgi:hypothetical protein